MRLTHDELTRDQRRAIAPEIGRAAHHEAGHALVCVLREMPLDHARLIYTFDDLGNGEAHLTVEGYIDVGDDAIDNPEDAVICGVAGAVAGAYWTHKEEGGALSRLIRQAWEAPTAESDAKVVRRYLPQTSLREADALDEAEALVRKHWSETRDVARELIRRDELSGRRITKIIT